MSMIQKQVILKAIRDPLFAKDVFTEIPITAFDEQKEFKDICLIINRYYQTNSAALSENTFLTLIEDKLDKQNASADKINDYFKVVKEIYVIAETDANEEVIDNQIQRFVRKTLSAHRIRETIAKENLDDESVIERLSDDLKRIAVMSTSGLNESLYDFFNDIEKKREMYRNMRDNRFSTGFATLDRIADGGLARGELGLIIAQSGGGKSTWAVQQVNNYVKRSMNVLYIILEEKLDRMSLKIEQNLLGAPKSKLIDREGNLDEVMFDQIQALYKRQPNLGNLFISKHKPQDVSVTMLEQIILDTSVRKGVQLDAVIIDYPDLMKNHHVKYHSESEAGGKLYEDIRALAQKYNYVCWVLSQLNRSGYSQDIKTAEAIEGSKRKLNAVEIAFTLNQTAQEKKEGFLRIHLDKIRYQGEHVYDKLQYFRVNPSGYVIRDASDEEVEYAKQLVNSKEPTGEPKNSYQDALSSITNINNAI